MMPTLLVGVSGMVTSWTIKVWALRTVVHGAVLVAKCTYYTAEEHNKPMTSQFIPPCAGTVIELTASVLIFYLIHPKTDHNNLLLLLPPPSASSCGRTARKRSIRTYQIASSCTCPWAERPC
jgi:hypothetical protein